LTLVAFTILAPVAVAARLVASRWLSPVAFFAGYWFLAALLPTLLLPGFDVSVESIVYVAFAAVAFTLGAASTGAVGGPVRTVSLNTGPLRLLVWAGCVAAVLAAGVQVHAGGFSLGRVFSPSGLLQVGATIAESRYEDHTATPAVVPACLAFTYAAAIVAPFIRLTPGASRWWTFAPAITSLAFSLVTAAKLTVVLTTILTIASLLAVRVLADGEAPRVSLRMVIRAGVATVVLVAVFVGISLVRYGPAGPRAMELIEQKSGVYAFGYQSGFAAWLSTHDDEPLRYGTATVSVVGLVDSGRTRDEQRRYSDFAQIGSAGEVTNIYTMFRGLLIDFGRPGALLFMFLFGTGCGVAYRRATSGMPLAAVALAMAYAMILFSTTTSIFTFNNVCAAFALAVLVVRAAFVPVAVPEGVPA
jgi:oligosaccharide repeat unit polymerase